MLCQAIIRPPYICLILCFALLSNLAMGQCGDSGNYWNESWVSCDKRTNPNPARGNSHWIVYEFHQPENISQSHIWNANRSGESERGARDVVVDYSVDGNTWVELDEYTFPRANENNNYAGFEGPDFGEIFVRKILITVLNTYGNGNCASIAEVQFNINTEACYGIIDECGQCNGNGATTWYLDADGDGFGHIDTAVQDCDQPNGYVDNADDYCDNGLLGWEQVGAIFKENGCTGCHNNNALGGLNLLTYETATEGGNKCGTDILTGTTLTDIITISGYDECGAPIGIPSMNERVGGQIDNNELALLQTWIDAGAPQDCNCLAGAPDADNDQTCDSVDDCPGFDNRLIGTSCDDGSICTENDVWTSACECKGQLATDSDNDGVCDIEDTAPNDPCTADGIIDGLEPTAWSALPTNDCDTDGINNVNGDLDDFAPCVDNEGQINTTACNCPNNMLLAGGSYITENGISKPGHAHGLPNGQVTSFIGSSDSLYLSFPYMAAGEEICIAVGFDNVDGIVNFSVNDNSFTFLNFAGLDNFEPQNFCFRTLTEGEQTVVIKEIGAGGIRIDGSSYNHCPCDSKDPYYRSPACNCPNNSTTEDGVYVSSLGFNNGDKADGAPDGNFTSFVGSSDTLVLEFPNITPGGEICITLGFNNEISLVRFDYGNESAYFANEAQDINFAPQEFCFINNSGDPRVVITEIEDGGIRVDGSYYTYCNDCPDNVGPDLPIKAELHAWLEGNYNPANGQMTTDLHARGLLPGQTPVAALATPTPAGQPYNVAPWNHNGTEGANWDDSYYTDTTSDWVLVSFRTGIDKNTEVAMTAALLHRDGSVSFPNRCVLPSDDTPLYVVIEHRNHIGIMSPSPIAIQGNILKYDFRFNDSYKDGTGFGQKQLPTGEWVMFAGDSNQMDFPSFDINGTDKSEWFENNGIFDYYLSPDFNLDGDVNGQDKSLWFENNGISSRVPK